MHVMVSNISHINFKFQISNINPELTLAVLLLPLQYLCCEVAALQRQGQLRQLKVFDVAHMAWRLRVACQLHEGVETNKEVGSTFGGAGKCTQTMLSSAHRKWRPAPPAVSSMHLRI
jgi:hypothetical protein